MFSNIEVTKVNDPDNFSMIMRMSCILEYASCENLQRVRFFFVHVKESKVFMQSNHGLNGATTKNDVLTS